MIGTFANTAAIVVGGTIGVLLKKVMPKRMEESVLGMLGISVTIIGFLGLLTNSLTVTGGKVSSNGELILLISLVVGNMLGELLQLDERMNGFGDFIEKKANISGFSKGFVNGTIIFCVGAMAIVGALDEGIRGDSSTLMFKSVLDFVGSMMFASSMGVGIVFSAVSVLVVQGGITLLAGYIGPMISEPLLAAICMVGYAIVIAVGFNTMGMTKFKAVNMLPALLVPMVYFLLVP